MEKNGKWRERRDCCEFFKASKAKRDFIKISDSGDDNSNSNNYYNNMANSHIYKEKYYQKWIDVPKEDQRGENQEYKSFSIYRFHSHFQLHYL
jgi:hypothetical protein